MNLNFFISHAFIERGLSDVSNGHACVLVLQFMVKRVILKNGKVCLFTIKIHPHKANVPGTLINK